MANDTMTNEMHSPRPSTSSSYRRRLRDTGFPEPFNGVSNTTLPHPDANLSPNAVISQDDISGVKFARRHRHSFRHKYKRTISHGRITPEMEAMYANAALIEEEEEEDGNDSALEGVRSRSDSSMNMPLTPGAGSGMPPAPGFLTVSTTGRPSTSKSADSLRSHNLDSPTASESSSKRRSILRKLKFLH